MPPTNATRIKTASNQISSKNVHSDPTIPGPDGHAINTYADQQKHIMNSIDAAQLDGENQMDPGSMNQQNRQYKNRRINQYNESKQKMQGNSNILASNQERVTKSFENDNTFKFKSTPNTSNNTGHVFSLSYSGVQKPASGNNSRTNQSAAQDNNLDQGPDGVMGIQKKLDNLLIAGTHDNNQQQFDDGIDNLNPLTIEEQERQNNLG